MNEFVDVMITKSLTTAYKVLTVGFRQNGNQVYIEKVDFLVRIQQGFIDLTVETREDITGLLRMLTNSGGWPRCIIIKSSTYGMALSLQER